MIRALFRSLALLAACAATSAPLADARGAGYTPPAKLVVTTDDNYPPFLFRAPDGTLQGIIRDKWALWAKATGVEVEVRGEAWSAAQASVQRGEADVIEALSRTRPREALYEFPQASASIEARIFFHRSITGIIDAPSLRGFQVAAKAGSAEPPMQKPTTSAPPPLSRSRRESGPAEVSVRMAFIALLPPSWWTQPGSPS